MITRCPYFADVFVRGQAAESFEAASIVVGIYKVAEMIAQLSMFFVVALTMAT